MKKRIMLNFEKYKKDFSKRECLETRNVFNMGIKFKLIILFFLLGTS
jgi:hypothetical protein